MRQALFVIPVLIFLGLAALFYRGLQEPPPNVLPSPLVGKSVPALTLPPLDDRSPGFTAGDLANGKPIIVNFWASWCTPCRAEHPLLEQLARDGRIPIYGVAYKDTAEKARAFLDELGSPFRRVVIDQPGRVSIDWGVTGVPETFVIDGKGVILAHYAGPLSPEIVENEILPLASRR